MQSRGSGKARPPLLPQRWTLRLARQVAPHPVFPDIWDCFAELLLPSCHSRGEKAGGNLEPDLNVA
eukprot:6803576-Alexandrium_andersonii.AAC.1